mmetsp:Transcript_55171/g.125453  ORF Transcript_55171/g.125453 Transcript_55171/m.125453 type:complete len:147 (-) Transcript_55171:259-699(-)
MAKHVDNFQLARPLDRLTDFVNWGERADEFSYNTHQRVLALQARRAGDETGACALEVNAGARERPVRHFVTKAVRVERLRNSDPDGHSLPGRLYQSDADRRRKLELEDRRSVGAFDALAEKIQKVKNIRGVLAEHRATLGREQPDG